MYLGTLPSVNMKRKFKTLIVMLAMCGFVLLPTFASDIAGRYRLPIEVGGAARADDLHRKGFSVRGTGYSDDIVELRIYRTTDSDLRFYDVQSLTEKQVVFRSRDKGIIAQILRAARMGPAVGERSLCGRHRMDYQLHILSLRKEDRVFGYFVVSPSDAVQDAPRDMADNCARVSFFDGHVHGWYSYDFFAELRALRIVYGVP